VLVETPVFQGTLLRPGNVLEGPAIVEYAASTAVVSGGQTATVDGLLNLSLRAAA
jgi:N-methylhydantoinase A